jgi:hypothetical protein
MLHVFVTGNYPLCRVLPQIYAVNKEPLHEHVMALVSLLPLCENPEKLALLNLFALIAKNNPSVSSDLCKFMHYHCMFKSLCWIATVLK